MENQRYENFVLENKLKDQLETKLSMLDYVTVDDSLTQTAGMTKKINFYKATGEAEDVAEGKGNTQSITMSYDQREYIVGTTQARWTYTDEAEMTDPYMVDGGMEKLSESLVNKMSAKVNDEFWHATRYVEVAANETAGYDHFVDAIAQFNKERDEELSLFALCNPAMRGKLRKALKDDLKYSESYVRTGYVGTVAGVPVIGDKLVPDNCIIIATKKAVTYFRKKNVTTEQEREGNIRTNIIAPAGTKPTITTASIVAGDDVTVGGACAAGATVEMLVNGNLVGTAVVSGTTWSGTLPKVATGDKVKVRASVKGEAMAVSEAKNATVS